MKALKWKLDSSLETIYFSLIPPTLDYGDILFGWTYDLDLCKFDMIQVMAMRIITGSGTTAKSNIKLLCEETAWTDMFTQCLHNVLCHFHKIINGMSLTALTNAYNFLTMYNQPYNLHGNDNILLSYAIMESYKRSFFPGAIHRY